jgi:hypothetical protein
MKYQNNIGGVMVSVIASSVVGRGVRTHVRSKQRLLNWYTCMLLLRWTYNIKEQKQRLVGSNSDNLTRWDDMFTRGLLFQWSSTIKAKVKVLV